MMTQYTIGQLARQAGLPASTIRYYEKRGLLASANRSTRNYRLYGDAAVARLCFIGAAKAAGFTLVEIGVLQQLQSADLPPWTEVQALIGARLKDIGEHIERMTLFQGQLVDLLRICRESEDTGRCGVLDRLASDRPTIPTKRMED